MPVILLFFISPWHKNEMNLFIILDVHGNGNILKEIVRKPTGCTVISVSMDTSEVWKIH